VKWRLLVSPVRNSLTFSGRGIPSGSIAPPSNIPDILGRRALPDGRRAPENLSPNFRLGTLVVGLAFIVSCHSPATRPSLRTGQLGGANVLLVTIDTLRADRVGAYGSTRGLTPTIDRFAAEGLRFTDSYAQVPLTLPSHASLMTASYPTRHGVRDNGAFRLGASAPTLAASLKAQGYRTAAFVGAFVLDARFGLNRGFDVYDDRMLDTGSDLEVVERPAEQVLAPAYQWITSGDREPGAGGAENIATQRQAPNPQTPPRGPWFAWVHLYDPHEPYAPPEPFRSRYASEPYDGEIAYTDAALGAFLNRLQTNGALGNTLVVIVSDHGESLGEHGERTHGLFAYDATLRVPLVMWAPPRLDRGVFGETMRLVDVAPTIVDLLGVPALQPADGRSVRPFIAGERRFEDEGSYFEALNANLTRHWAPLGGLVRNRLKLVDLPVPELYDLAIDPGELTNVYARQRDRARDLEERLDRITKNATAPASTPLDADAEARLRSLGYVVGSSSGPPKTYTAADDPKRLVHLNQALDEAAAAWSRGDAQQAMTLLRRTIDERPDLTIAYERLGFMLRATGRVAEAVSLLDRAAREGHGDTRLLRSLGSLLRDAGDLGRSASVLGEVVRADPSDLQAADALGQTYTRWRRWREAEALFRHVIASSPNAATTWNNLGALYLTENRAADAVDALSRAVAIDPALAGAHNGLGVAYARTGRMDRAVVEWRRALELRPGFTDALSNLQRAQAPK
jgi:arylsulfatase A-like enzyme/Flp pilus assembly protein TadD